MGLGSFIGMIVDGIPSRLGYFMVNNLDTNTLEMTLNHGTIIINEETVHQILKFPIGGIDLATVEPDSQSNALATTWKKQYEKEKMHPTDVMNMILESSDNGVEFKLNFLILFVNSMAECSGMGCCTLNFLHRIKNTNMIPRVNWSRNIFECLKRSKNRSSGWCTTITKMEYESFATKVSKWNQRRGGLQMAKLKQLPASKPRPIRQPRPEDIPSTSANPCDIDSVKKMMKIIIWCYTQPLSVQEGVRMCTPTKLNFDNADSLEAQSPLSSYWYSQTTFGFMDVQIIEQSGGSKEEGGQPCHNVKETDFPIVPYVEEDVEPIRIIPVSPDILVTSFNLGISQPCDSPNASGKGKEPIIYADEHLNSTLDAQRGLTDDVEKGMIKIATAL
ncbi:hypothetical protein L6452_05264 [Arctium lappa]|uniref:Uncharacterized protein n=1 Tax=Arctium lappa TaxID=4217 RepID=A0ACB9EH02_ARCLA|nr:hypothetical protein L6452_05264 [Arctium lappa]